MRLNPGRETDGELTHDMIVDIYKDFLSEVEMLSHKNHKNVSKMVDALRNERGSLFIIMKYYDEGDLHIQKLKNTIYKE